MGRILYLPIETIARELDAKLLLAHRALGRGYSIIIGQKNNVFKAAELIGYGTYFYKSHGIGNFPRQNNHNISGFKYVALDEEGLVFVDDAEYIRNSKPHELDHLDIVFTWGSYQRNLLLKENPDLKSKTISVGNPRFDLLRPEFSSLYKSVSEKICKTWGRYILVNTRFGPGNFSRHYGCSYTEAREHLFLKNIGRPPSKSEMDFLLEEEKYYQELFKQYVEMFFLLSFKFPDLNFILRPHPSEDHLNWTEALKDLQNVHVVFEGSAADWIHGALAVIHTGCTTGIESWALKKPVIAYNPNTKKGIEPGLPNKFAHTINNINELQDMLMDITSGKFKNNFEEKLETAKLFIESIDGKLSVERILDALDSMPGIKNNEIKDKDKSIYLQLRKMESFKRAMKFRILKWLRKNQPVIRKLIGKKVTDYIFGKFKKYPGIIAQFQKFPGLDAKYILERLFVFDFIFNDKNVKNYLIRKIATDTYLIDK